MMKHLAFLITLLIASASQAITIGEIVNPLESYLECEDLEWYEKAICEEVSDKVNKELSRSNISFNNGDIVFYKSPMIPRRRINTGHSCTHKAWIQDNYVRASLFSSGEINLNGNSISRPMVLYTNLPINVYAKVNLKEQWGHRILFGSCNKTGDDRYYADGAVSLNAKTRIFVSLEPKLNILSNGDYEITIKPISDVAVDFENINIKFDFHSKSILNGFATAIFGGTSSALQSIEAAFRGESISDELKKLGLSLAVSFAQTLDSISDLLLDDIIFDLVAEKAEEKIIEKSEGFQNNIELNIDRQLTKILKLDVNGERSFLIKSSAVSDKLTSVLVPINSFLL